MLLEVDILRFLFFVLDDGFNHKIGDEGSVEDDVLVETSGDGCRKASDGTLSRMWKFH